MKLLSPHKSRNRNPQEKTAGNLIIQRANVREGPASPALHEINPQLSIPR